MGVKTKLKWRNPSPYAEIYAAIRAADVGQWVEFSSYSQGITRNDVKKMRSNLSLGVIRGGVYGEGVRIETTTGRTNMNIYIFRVRKVKTE